MKTVEWSGVAPSAPAEASGMTLDAKPTFAIAIPSQSYVRLGTARYLPWTLAVAFHRPDVGRARGGGVHEGDALAEPVSATKPAMRTARRAAPLHLSQTGRIRPSEGRARPTESLHSTCSVRRSTRAPPGGMSDGRGELTRCPVAAGFSSGPRGNAAGRCRGLCNPTATCMD
jgi:hypothetical protein